MGQTYLQLPFSLAGGSLAKVSLRDSIYQFVNLIIGSRAGSFPFEPTFGCHIWDAEYTYLTEKSKGDIRSQIRQALSAYEKRLKDVSVNVKKSRVDRKRRRICLVARVKGKFTEHGEEQTFDEEYSLWQPRREGLI